MGTMNTDLAKRQMVQQQLRVWDVSDAAVLGVVHELARDRFVPAGFEQLAYADAEIPLAHGQWMMTPIVEGRLLQALALDRSSEVLEIGTGTGYLTACLASLAASVTSIDIHQTFVDGAGEILSESGIENVTLSRMDAASELPDGQFDAIAVTGSLPRLDDRLLARLKPGGRLFVVLGESPVMEAQIVTHDDDSARSSTSLFETDILALENFVAPPAFSF